LDHVTATRLLAERERSPPGQLLQRKWPLASVV